MTKIIITTGGTGGHIFPAEAIAKGLLDAGYEVIFMTDKRGASFRKLTQIPTQVIAATSVTGRSFLGKIGALRTGSDRPAPQEGRASASGRGLASRTGSRSRRAPSRRRGTSWRSGAGTRPRAGPSPRACARRRRRRTRRLWHLSSRHTAPRSRSRRRVERIVVVGS